MKKILLSIIGLTFCMTVQAQSQTSNRIVYGNHQADIELEEVSPNEANVYLSNPQGSEQAVINIKASDIKDLETSDVIETTVYDKTTGKQLAHSSGKKGEYIDSTAQTDYASHEIHLKKTGPNDKDISGTIKYSTRDTSMDIQLTNGKPIGRFSEIENGIKTETTILSDGSMQAVYSDDRTKEILYKAVGTQDYMYLYDRNGRLIAEGDGDTPQIHDAKAFAEFEQIIGDEDDDEDEF